MTIHMFSSIRMGENPLLSVANSYGKIWVENLYVADASLIPESPASDLQAMSSSARCKSLYKQKRLDF